MTGNLNVTIIGLSLTSSWDNGHATTYRTLIKGLRSRGHSILFLERDLPWSAQNRDLPEPPYCVTSLYDSLEELRDLHTEAVRQADVVIVGSGVADGPEVLDWVLAEAHGLRAFYDLDTPVTLARLDARTCPYLRPDQIQALDLYLSYSGGAALRKLESSFRAPCARPLYGSADPETHFPEDVPILYDLGYLGTYASDRQHALERLVLDVARQCPEARFAVAGPMFPDAIRWPENCTHTPSLPQNARSFYNAQRFTLNLTRADRVRLGHSPSLRLFEAAACGTPVISDAWSGLESFFAPGFEILVAHAASEVLRILKNTPEDVRLQIGERARRRVLGMHTGYHRAEELERHLRAAANLRAQSARRAA